MADDDQSIREMAEANEDLEELFPLGSLDGDDTTLGQLIRPNQPVEITVSMASAEVPSPKGGLFNPNRLALLLVTTEVGNYVPVPVREGERHDGKKIVGWKIRQMLRPVYVERAKGDGAQIEAAFAALLAEDQTAAAALVERLQARTSRALGSPVNA